MYLKVLQERHTVLWNALHTQEKWEGMSLRPYHNRMEATMKAIRILTIVIVLYSLFTLYTNDKHSAEMEDFISQRAETASLPDWASCPINGGLCIVDIHPPITTGISIFAMSTAMYHNHGESNTIWMTEGDVLTDDDKFGLQQCYVKHDQNYC